jgi:2Fe-2S ferredoxin
MITIHLVSANGSTNTLQGKPGMSLMQTAINANAPGIEAECGGMLVCSTCHVIVRAPFAQRLPLPEPDEIAMLEFTASPHQTGSRLSCQIQLSDALDGLIVDLPPSQY